MTNWNGGAAALASMALLQGGCYTAGSEGWQRLDAPHAAAQGADVRELPLGDRFAANVRRDGADLVVDVQRGSLCRRAVVGALEVNEQRELHQARWPYYVAAGVGVLGLLTIAGAATEQAAINQGLSLDKHGDATTLAAGGVLMGVGAVGLVTLALMPSHLAEARTSAAPEKAVWVPDEGERVCAGAPPSVAGTSVTVSVRFGEGAPLAEWTQPAGPDGRARFQRAAARIARAAARCGEAGVVVSLGVAPVPRQEPSEPFGARFVEVPAPELLRLRGEALPAAEAGDDELAARCARAGAAGR